MHAQETLASSATFAGLTGSIPIEGERPGSRICGPKTTDGRAIQAEWASGVGRVQGAAKRGQITNTLERKRSTTHPLELAGTERRPELIARFVVITIGVQLRRLGWYGRGRPGRGAAR